MSAASGAAIGAGAAIVTVAPVVLVLALVAALTGAVLATVADPASDVDPARVPPLARDLLPEIVTLTTQHCPDLPPIWVVAEIAAESGWNPRAFARDRNGGTAGLYQLNQANWVAAGGRPWGSTPPPSTADVLDPRRHLEHAVPWVCTNLHTATAHLRQASKSAAPLDAMLVCHIAGCDRVTGSATGIPTAGEAGCDRGCADLVARYVASVHRYLTLYADIPRTVDISGLPTPTSFVDKDGGCTLPDPTTRGCLTAATRHALDQSLAAFGPPGPVATIHSVTCWDPHPQNPRSDHRTGRACDFFPTTPGTFATGQDLANGWRLAAWLRAHASELRIHYIIWHGRYWDPTTTDDHGWGRPYSGGGIYDPTDVTGGHYDHIHVSVL